MGNILDGTSSGYTGKAQDVIDALVNAGKDVHKIFQSLKNIDVLPKVNDLNQRIRALNIEAAGLDTKDAPSYPLMVEKLSTIRKQLIATQLLLRSYVFGTINRIGSLEKTVNVIGELPDKGTYGFQVAAKLMLNIVKDTNDVLPKAEKNMAQINDLLKAVSSHLQSLETVLENHSSKVHKEWELKKAEYGHIRRKRLDPISMIGGILAIIGATTGIAFGANFLASGYSNLDDIAKTMDKAKAKMEEIDNEFKQFKLKAEELDEQHKQKMNELFKIKNEFAIQQHEIQMTMFEFQQVSIQTAMHSFKFLIRDFSGTSTQLRTKLVPLGDHKVKLTKLINSLNQSSAGNQLKLGQLGKASIMNMIINLRAACNSYINKRIVNEYQYLNQK